MPGLTMPLQFRLGRAWPYINIKYKYNLRNKYVNNNIINYK